MRKGLIETEAKCEVVRIFDPVRIPMQSWVGSITSPRLPNPSRAPWVGS